jgi:hypothetical protein
MCDRFAIQVIGDCKNYENCEILIIKGLPSTQSSVSQMYNVCDGFINLRLRRTAMNLQQSTSSEMCRFI